MGDAEQKGSRQTKQQRPVQRLQRSHELKCLSKSQIHVSVSRHRIQRVENGGTGVW